MKVGNAIQGASVPHECRLMMVQNPLSTAILRWGVCTQQSIYCHCKWRLLWNMENCLMCAPRLGLKKESCEEASRCGIVGISIFAHCWLLG